jgi:hypothetical protein
MSLKIDDAISQGFDAGNYASAYRSNDLEDALARLSMNRSAEYVASFTLGFLSSYTEDEMGEALDAYLDAKSLVGVRAAQLGIAIGEDDNEDV